MRVAGRKVLVVGLARSGLAAARLLVSRGADVTANDAKPASQLEVEAGELAGLGVKLALGGHPEELFAGAELVVVSPGVPADLPALAAARRAGASVVSEVELAAQFLTGRIIGITGSNGKTTTTTLAGELMRAAGARVLVGGNIGVPLSSLVSQSTADGWLVAELSSFQLETVDTLRVNVAVITNITPDHLDRHPSFDDYVKAKKRIFRNQTGDDWAVLNGQDRSTAHYIDSSEAAAKRVHFSLSGPTTLSGRPASIYLRNSAIYTTKGSPGGNDTRVVPLEEIPLPGSHNVENIMAALAATLCAFESASVDFDAIRNSIRKFKGVEHRIEFVAEIEGVRFYNDSKATNVDSTIKALEAFDRNVILILGGKDKGSDYTQLAPLISDRVKRVVVIGAATQKIIEQLDGICEMTPAGSMSEAVSIAKECAVSGDTVLLAPACASFDMFDNYEQRGRVFKHAVKEHAGITAGTEKAR